MQQLTNGVAPEILARHEQLTALVPIDRQVSWLGLAESKASLLKQLTEKELAAQQLLLQWETSDALALQNNLQAYRKAVADMQELRKGFTRYLDMIADEMMQPEKRAAAWEVVSKADARRIELVKAKAEEENKLNDKKLERSRFEAHVRNEYARIKGEYHAMLLKAIDDYYDNALGCDLDDEGIKKHFETAVLALGDIKAPEAKKFDYKLHSREEMIPIWQAIPQPNFLEILSQARGGLKERYSLYHNDKHQAKQAIEHIRAQSQETMAKVFQGIQTEIATNTLVAEAAEFTLTQPDGVKAVVKKQAIVIKDEDLSWAHKVIASFLANWNRVVPVLTVKKFGNLSVAQMAAALDKSEVKVDGVDYITVEK